MGAKRKQKPVPAPDPDPDRSASAAKDPADEIDAIFSRCKKLRASSLPTDAAHEKKRKDQDEGDGPLKNPARKRVEETVQGSTMKKKKKKKKKQKKVEGEGVGGKLPSQAPPDPMKPRRKTEDGLAIYTEEDLGWNKKNAGGTKLCPFDCDCCF
jgi:hypothetical protein